MVLVGGLFEYDFSAIVGNLQDGWCRCKQRMAVLDPLGGVGALAGTLGLSSDATGQADERPHIIDPVSDLADSPFVRRVGRYGPSAAGWSSCILNIVLATGGYPPAHALILYKNPGLTLRSTP